MAVAIAAASLYGPSGAAAHSFRVGLLLPLIGPSAGAGKQILDGFMLATKERDAHPGRRKMRSIPPPPARRFFSSAWAMRPGNYRGSRAPPISFPSPSGGGGNRRGVRRIVPKRVRTRIHAACRSGVWHRAAHRLIGSAVRALGGELADREAQLPIATAPDKSLHPTRKTM